MQPQEELKIEFTYYPFSRLDASVVREGLHIDSLEDIAANKLMALVDRMEAKDFVDLYFIMHEKGVSLEALRTLTDKKHGFQFDPVMLGSEFAKVRRIEALPKMIKSLTIEELKKFFEDRALELKRDIF